MPDPSLYSTHTIDTHPLRLHEGAVVGDGERIAWLKHSNEVWSKQYASIKAELAKRDETIRQQKGTINAGCQCVIDLEAAIASLRSELEKRDETIETLHGTQQQANDALNNLHQRLSEADETIASLRSQLTRAAAIEEATGLVLWRLGQMSPSDKRSFCLDGVESMLVDAIASPSPGPSVTPGGEREAIRDSTFEPRPWPVDPNGWPYRTSRPAMRPPGKLEAHQ